VRELIHAMAATKAIVISTHILEEVEALCNRAIIIARGRIVADGTPEELRARSDRHNAVTLRLPADLAQRATDVLRPLPDVAGVEMLAQANGVVDLLVRPANGRSITAEVGAALRTSHIDVDELHTERGRLDDVFRGITAGQ
jgi:ABC-2 type transport system ATP-binding protein